MALCHKAAGQATIYSPDKEPYRYSKVTVGSTTLPVPGIEREAGFAQPEVVVSNYSKAEVNATASPTSLVTGSMRDKFQLNEIDPFDHSKQQPKHLDQVHKGLTYDAKPMVVKHTKSRKAGGKTIDNDFAHLVRSGYQQDFVDGMDARESALISNSGTLQRHLKLQQKLAIEKSVERVKKGSAKEPPKKRMIPKHLQNIQSRTSTTRS